MPFVAVVTLIAVALIVLPLTLALFRIILSLHEVSFNLGTIVALINSIGRQTDTVTPTIATANLRLTPVEDGCAALAARHGRANGNGRVVDLTVR
jgi:hypothetical protein